jgi:hypothetical protein
MSGPALVVGSNKQGYRGFQLLNKESQLRDELRHFRNKELELLKMQSMAQLLIICCT